MKPDSGGGLLLLRRITPLARRHTVYFCSGAYTCGSEPSIDRTRLRILDSQSQTWIGRRPDSGFECLWKQGDGPRLLQQPFWRPFVEFGFARGCVQMGKGSRLLDYLMRAYSGTALNRKELWKTAHSLVAGLRKIQRDRDVWVSGPIAHCVRPPSHPLDNNVCLTANRRSKKRQPNSRARRTAERAIS
jgi:hypothetical protein